MIDLKKARGDVSKSELARRSGIPIRDIRRIENTPGYDPRFSRVVALADALGVPLDRLRSHAEADTSLDAGGPNHAIPPAKPTGSTPLLSEAAPSPLKTGA